MRDGMILSKFKAVAIFLWFLAALGLGLFELLPRIVAEDFFESAVSLKLTLHISIGAGLIANALYYIRRLYKDIFLQGLRDSGEKLGAKELATLMYFLSRPLFSILFSVLVVISAAAFVDTTTVKGSQLSTGFALFCALLSAYGAVATGSAIRRLENLAANKMGDFGGDLQ